ncbi:hypothetical protein PHYBLDRAFT_161111 [Phycomyces blakesleeanus NRRL 1555(-)]|uniref:Uncharacterized protein n=1 Tax=Phycomyces blakesleeanus (strain ATCC 8743b / DSM 1359 / FGSC 10004 / NBRC 33097 / NRRL 1555) TaxID=763407 RepID=A0A162Q682_PHYB8|nr:hypothetical protein PHYBLDRAFT_161111 [Phycomyces blakesleeanus NRRL 1555(-)]OAD80466.1 hypothetical protein PHYBLDRAFT_161111 [Phycomyces blakesleeanus NRRL 1555(-)]|eukprot:XP_018298506.1 hypothetical protein PHYBLDRAFT_161111 [Phycomyces blakesleeanus NRRL 1555(-)]
MINLIKVVCCVLVWCGVVWCGVLIVQFTGVFFPLDADDGCLEFGMESIWAQMAVGVLGRIMIMIMILVNYQLSITYSDLDLDLALALALSISFGCATLMRSEAVLHTQNQELQIHILVLPAKAIQSGLVYSGLV